MWYIYCKTTKNLMGPYKTLVAASREVPGAFNPEFASGHIVLKEVD